MSSGDPWSLPVKQGLYDPTLEKDACGVGFIVAIDGKRSHKVRSQSESHKIKIPNDRARTNIFKKIKMYKKKLKILSQILNKNIVTARTV